MQKGINFLQKSEKYSFSRETGKKTYKAINDTPRSKLRGISAIRFDYFGYMPLDSAPRCGRRDTRPIKVNSKIKNGIKDDIKNAELIGISDIIIKPVIAAELSEMISNVLNNTKQKKRDEKINIM